MLGNNITPQTDAATSQIAGPRESRKKKLGKALLGTVTIIAAGWFILTDSPPPPVEADRGTVARNGEIGSAFGIRVEPRFDGIADLGPGVVLLIASDYGTTEVDPK